ncbi:MAG: glucosaminidase domain-containing protein [Colwellia sp.]|nr:glucosaminidase domain-containing protein [Colwellia sp.]
MSTLFHRITLVLIATLAADHLTVIAKTNGNEVKVVANKNHNKAINIRISSLDDLKALFEQHEYTSKSWAKGNREVPRITFDSVSENWKHSSSNLPVKIKKEIFFRVMAPLVLMANENIITERNIIKKAALNSDALKILAKKYHINKDFDESMSEDKRTNLLMKVDIMPPSLALAQAAEESGWGTSRFTSQGNAFFGQWDFSGKGMIPKQQRKELGNYGLARFVSPLASVEGYMYNINTTKAYQGLREQRAKLRQKKKAITGLELANSLGKYSERGQAYIDSIKTMIRYNKLQDIDEAYLSDSKLIHLVSD